MDILLGGLQLSSWFIWNPTCYFCLSVCDPTCLKPVSGSLSVCWDFGPCFGPYILSSDFVMCYILLTNLVLYPDTPSTLCSCTSLPGCCWPWPVSWRHSACVLAILLPLGAACYIGPYANLYTRIPCHHYWDCWTREQEKPPLQLDLCQVRDSALTCEGSKSCLGASIKCNLLTPESGTEWRGAKIIWICEDGKYKTLTQMKNWASKRCYDCDIIPSSERTKTFWELTGSS